MMGHTSSAVHQFWFHTFMFLSSATMVSRSKGSNGGISPVGARMGRSLDNDDETRERCRSRSKSKSRGKSRSATTTEQDDGKEDFFTSSIADSVKKRRRRQSIEPSIVTTTPKKTVYTKNLRSIATPQKIDGNTNTEETKAHDSSIQNAIDGDINDNARSLCKSIESNLEIPIEQPYQQHAAGDEQSTTNNPHHQHHHHHHHHHKPRRNEFPIPFVDSRWLVISSMFFIIPGIQALTCQQPFYFTLSLITSIISAVYWYDACLGWRHTLDWYFAKISFVIYFITGALYVTDPYLHLIGWPICVVILWAFWMSGQEWKRDKSTWMYYHMTFHFFVAIEQAIVITGSFSQCHYTNYPWIPIGQS